MGAVSRNYYDVIMWVEKVIDSMDSIQQYKACSMLIRNIAKTYDCKSTDRHFDKFKLQRQLSAKVTELVSKT